MPAKKTVAPSADNTPDQGLNLEPLSPGRNAARRRTRDPMQFFTIAEVAAFIGASPRTVRRWISSGDLIAHHFGGLVRVAEADFRAFQAIHRDG